jgi:hypothetical protein
MESICNSLLLLTQHAPHHFFDGLCLIRMHACIFRRPLNKVASRGHYIPYLPWHPHSVQWRCDLCISLPKTVLCTGREPCSFLPPVCILLRYIVLIYYRYVLSEFGCLNVRQKLTTHSIDTVGGRGFKERPVQLNCGCSDDRGWRQQIQRNKWFAHSPSYHGGNTIVGR